MVCKKKYDIIYSIGADCGCAMNLNKFGLRLTSGPFDWLFKASFEKRFEILMNDFEHFLDKDDLVKFEKDKNAKLQDVKHDYYYNKSTGFMFLHDFPIGLSLDSSFDKVKEKYDRRIKRFLENINTQKKILLVWYSLNSKTDVKLIKNLCDEYCLKIGKSIDFLIIENDQQLNDTNKIISENIAENIYLYRGYFYQENEPVSGNYNLCKKVFNNYLVRKYKSLGEYIFSVALSKEETHRIYTVLGLRVKFKISE